MGRKRWWRGGLWELMLLLSTFNRVIVGDDEVGLYFYTQI